MNSDITFKDLMGALAVVIAVVAYAIYAWQTLRGEARPHPLSWLIFGILTGTGYLVQLDQAAGPGSWVMGDHHDRLFAAVPDEFLARASEPFPGTNGRSWSWRRSSSGFICGRAARRCSPRH